MKIVDATSTELFVGRDDAPLQVVTVSLLNTGDAAWTSDEPATVEVSSDGFVSVASAEVTEVGPSERITVEIGVPVDPDLPPGTTIAAEVGGSARNRRDRRTFDFTVAEPGWRMFMVAHFHYDPVWWNTQAFYTETWEKLPRSERPWEGRRQQPAFTLIEAHVDLARRDPDYKFVLAELDYLKPYWDAFPEERAYLRQLLAEGRLELMGGTYNEANTNLTSAESTIRNAVYGVGYQRDVLGGAPATAWQLDVFGHDPQFPGMMADAGLTSSSWARGPFHQWGPRLGVGDNRRMQFDSEFDWVAPSGRGLLTSYMPNHYSAGWDIDKASTLAEAESEALRLFTELKPVAATRNVLLPVGTDYTPPGRWITDIHRGWNARYVWPKFLVALPREFFDAVRAELGDRGAAPQTRDMNPVYTGKDVSFIDTKQAQREGENTLLSAEKFSTVAALLGARYPSEAFDKAWRQLLFGAHHDGITGTESDQVYLDLVGGWRDTWELGREALHDALDYIAGHVDTRRRDRQTADQTNEAEAGFRRSALTVFNPLSWERTDVVEADVTLEPPAPGIKLLDDSGREVPFVVDAPSRDDQGLLRGCTLSFIATDVPSVGYRTYQLLATDRLPEDATWERVEAHRIANDFYELEVDPDRGGAICELVDRRDKRSVLKPGGLANELLAYDEYPTHPDHGEGPWHLLPVGTVRSSAGEVDGGGNAATVTAERSAIGERILSTTRFDGCDVAQEVALYAGVPRVDCVTSLDGFTGQDTLFRMRVAADVPGGMPVSEVGNAVIGRGFGFPAVDVADVPYTLDNPAYNWFALSSTVRVSLREPLAPGDDEDAFPPEHASRAMSVAEVIVPDGAETSERVRDLVVALVRKGVTSTVSRATGNRYGDIAADSNLPDARIAVGRPEDNPFVADVLADADAAYRTWLEEQLATGGVARVWVPARRPLRDAWQPNADLRGPRDLPVLVIAGTDSAQTAAALDAVRDDLADAVIGVAQPASMAVAAGIAVTADGAGASQGSLERVDDYTVGVCNRGMPSFNVDAHGDLYLSFLRSCSGWPSGVWLDPPRRTVPDGSSFQFQHWTHHFAYALVAGAGDWREAGLVRAGHAYNNPLHAVQVDAHAGPLPATAGFVRVDSDDVVVTTMKPIGNPMARMSGTTADPSNGVALRIYEANGTDADARVDLLWPVRDGFATDLLESARRRIEVADGAVRHRLAPYEIVTLGAIVDEPPASGQPIELGRRGEPAQPVFSDYWLHNKGAAPVGYQPVTVQIPPRAIAAQGGETDAAFEVPIVVASERTDDVVAGMLEVTVPPGWTADPPTHPYRLAPGAHVAVTTTVTPAPDAGAGRYFVGARIRDDAGQVHEDVLTVDLGQAEHTAETGGGVTRALALDRATRKAVVMDRPYDTSTTTMLGGEIRVEAHGATGEGVINVELHNLVDDEIRGEAQIISPWGTWEHLRPWTQGFAVAPRASCTVAFTVDTPAGARHVSAWALVKVMYFGRVYYTPSFPLTLGGADTGSRRVQAASARP